MLIKVKTQNIYVALTILLLEEGQHRLLFAFSRPEIFLVLIRGPSLAPLAEVIQGGDDLLVELLQGLVVLLEVVDDVVGDLLDHALARDGLLDHSSQGDSHPKVKKKN